MAKETRYVPGTYAKRLPSGKAAAGKVVQQWEKKRLKVMKEKAERARITNCIAVSRKIGVGALEIADIVSEKLDMQVIDREILEYMASDGQLGKKTVDFFDERYPGVMKEFASLLFGEKSFTMGDYLRHLASAVYAVADMQPSVFVGRGVHLILPRERVLAVRFIASKKFRVRRVAGILNISEADAEKEVDTADREQRQFFKINFDKKDASPYEFDLVINRDYLSDPDSAAEVVATAYRKKFG